MEITIAEVTDNRRGDVLCGCLALVSIAKAKLV